MMIHDLLKQFKIFALSADVPEMPGQICSKSCAQPVCIQPFALMRKVAGAAAAMRASQTIINEVCVPLPELSVTPIRRFDILQATKTTKLKFDPDDATFSNYLP